MKKEINKISIPLLLFPSDLIQPPFIATSRFKTLSSIDDRNDSPTFRPTRLLTKSSSHRSGEGKHLTSFPSIEFHCAKHAFPLDPKAFHLQEIRGANIRVN